MPKSNADRLTKAEREKIGQALRDYTGFAVQCFAGDMLDQGYPLSAEMTEILLEDMTDEDVGYFFAKWCDARELVRSNGGKANA